MEEGERERGSEEREEDKRRAACSLFTILRYVLSSNGLGYIITGVLRTPKE
jgi:hypothetical protein